MKIANDLRWMNSGPLAGLGEIALPALQPGSSIMPGKVNPVIPEAAAMVAAQVIGNDATITIAGQSGNFQLNVMLPVIAYNLLREHPSCWPTSRALLADKAIAGFKVNKARLAEALDRNPILVTALNPVIGYEKGAAIAKKAYAEGRPIREVAAEDDRPAARGARAAARSGGAHPRRHQGRHERRRLRRMARTPAGAAAPTAAAPSTGRRGIRERLRGSEPRHALRGLARARPRRRSRAARYRRYFPPEPVAGGGAGAAGRAPAELTVLLTQRATQLRNHAGQISFPGGRIEPRMRVPARRRCARRTRRSAWSRASCRWSATCRITWS